MVEKKGTSKKRFCIDFRKLNALTKTETFPIPRIDDALDSLAGSKLFSTLDFNNAYWQLPLHHKSKEKTAFSTMSGNYQFSKMPFGLKNAVAAFCRTISNVLGNLKWNSCFVYLDDIVVFGRTIEEHNQRLDQVLDFVTSAGFMLNPKKCYFGMREITYLGYKVNEHGIMPDDVKTERIRKALPPKNISQLRTFLGMTGYYRDHVPLFGDLTSPMHALLQKNVKFVWTKECQDNFTKIQQILSTQPLLAHFEPNRETIISCDASQYALGAVTYWTVGHLRWSSTKDKDDMTA